MSRWLITFKTISPHDLVETWEVGIREAYYRQLQIKGHAATLQRIRLVHEILGQPISLFEGWSRPEKENCYVYVGSPKRDYLSESLDVPARPNSLFLVFILSDGTIDLWNWRTRAPGSINIPEDVKGKLIWQRPQLPPN